MSLVTVLALLSACGRDTVTEPEPCAVVPGRHVCDFADDASGPQVHVMYVLPSDAADRELDLTGAIANSVGSWGHWLAAQTGGRQLRLDTFEGALDITFVRLSRSDAQMKRYGAFIRDTIERDLSRVGFNSGNKVYAVYYDGGSDWSCGAGAWPPAIRGRVAAMYLRGTPPGSPACATNSLAASPSAPPGYFEFGMLHEVLHTLGFVSSHAPREHAAGHVPESNDLMYSGTAPWALPNLVLDIGQDDYYGANVPAGVLNLRDSPFLLFAPTSTQSMVFVDDGQSEPGTESPAGLSVVRAAPTR